MTPTSRLGATGPSRIRGRDSTSSGMANEFTVSPLLVKSIPRETATRSVAYPILSQPPPRDSCRGCAESGAPGNKKPPESENSEGLSGGGGSRTGVGQKRAIRRLVRCGNASGACRPRGCGVGCGAFLVRVPRIPALPFVERRDRTPLWHGRERMASNAAGHLPPSPTSCWLRSCCEAELRTCLQPPQLCAHRGVRRPTQDVRPETLRVLVPCEPLGEAA